MRTRLASASVELVAGHVGQRGSGRSAGRPARGRWRPARPDARPASSASSRAAIRVCRLVGAASWSRSTELVVVVDEDVSALACDHRVAVDQGPDRLDGVERDALGARDERGCGPAPAAPRPARRRASSIAASASGSRSTTVARRPVASEGRRSSSSGRVRSSTNSWRATGLEQVLDEVEQPGVGVLHVLEQQHDRLRRRRPARRRSSRRRTGRSRSKTEPVAHLRAAPPAAGVSQAASSGVGATAATPARTFARDLGRVVALEQPEAGAHHLGERPEGHAVAVGQAPAAVPPDHGCRARRRTSRTPSRAGSCRRRPAGHQRPGGRGRPPRWRGTAP